MCGRYTQTADPAELQEFFELDQIEIAKLKANFNITPTSQVYVIDELSGPRQLRVVEWGLIPGWVKDLQTARPLINARAETVAEKPSFRDAFRASRALVPATGWYEWRSIGLAEGDKTKQPYYLKSTSAEPMAFAGILAAVKTPAGDWRRTMAILTTDACAELSTIHDRMPVILPRTDWDSWLSQATDQQELLKLFHPTAPGQVSVHAVSQAVNSNRASGPELILPIEVD